MIDVALLAARLLLLVLLYLFLLAAIRAGIGLVSGQTKPKPGGFVLRITQGPDERRPVAELDDAISGTSTLTCR